MSEVEEKTSTKPPRRPDPVIIYKRWCKACGICIEMCPRNVFDTDPDGYPVVARGMDCTQCAICWLHCPDFAITSTEK